MRRSGKIDPIVSPSIVAQSLFVHNLGQFRNSLDGTGQMALSCLALHLLFLLAQSFGLKAFGLAVPIPNSHTRIYILRYYERRLDSPVYFMNMDPL